MSPPYCELAVATCFSFLRGASYPGELVQAAAELGHAAIAVTDRNTLAGVVRALLSRLVEAAPGRVWLAAAMTYGPADARRLDRLADMAAATGAKLLAVNDVLYHAPERRPLQDVMSCIREHTTLAAAGRRLQ